MYYQWIYNQSVPNSLLQKHKCLTIGRDLFLQKKANSFLADANTIVKPLVVSVFPVPAGPENFHCQI